MKRIPPAFALLATLLAVLLPLEQSHCAWMGLMPHAPRAAANASHACCRHGAKPAPEARPSADCACMNLPAGSIPAALSSGSSPIVPSSAVAAETFMLPRVVAVAAAPPLDVGSPPLLIKLGAHGLRAPPRSA